MKNRGVTIIETVIVLSIFAIIIIVILGLYISHCNLYRMENSASVIKMQKTVFVKTFRETAEASNAIVAEKTIGTVAYTSSSSTIIFKMPAIDENKNTISGIFDYAVFYKTGSDFYIETDADSTSQRKDLKRKISDKMDSIAFRYSSETPSLASYVSASAYFQDNTVFQEEISSSAYLRNK